MNRKGDMLLLEAGSTMKCNTLGGRGERVILSPFTANIAVGLVLLAIGVANNYRSKNRTKMVELK